MNKQEILQFLDGFCPDITVDNQRYVHINNNFLCGLEIMDNAIVLFYPHYNKEKCELYSNIDNYDDITDIWSEFLYRVRQTNKRLKLA